MHTAYADTADTIWLDRITEHWYGDYQLVLAPGSYIIAGTAVSFKHNKIIGAGSGAFVITGTAAAILHNRILEVGAGDYKISGSDILMYDPGAGVMYVSFYVWKTTITENSILAWQVPYEARFVIDRSDRTKRVKADLPLELVIRR